MNGGEFPTAVEAWNLIQAVRARGLGVHELPAIVRDSIECAGRLSHHRYIDRYTFERCYQTNLELHKSGVSIRVKRRRETAQRELQKMRQLLNGERESCH